MKKIYTVILIVLSFQLTFAQLQSFTSSGNFIVPTGVTSITVEVVGAGGSGGTNGGGGGGGGGYAKGVYAVTPNASLPVTIGNGGSGSVGGTSSLSSLISATGGGNGTSVSNPNVGGGGAGGTGVNGNIVNRTGGTGGGGYWTYFGGGGAGAGGSTANGSNGGNTIVYVPGGCMTPGGSGGNGGGAPAGNGGKGAGFVNNSCTVTDPAAGGNNYGGGGGGGNGIGSAVGVGANGYIEITWGNNCVAPASPTNVTAQSNATVCGPSSTTLSAISTGTVVWYSGATGGLPVGTGTNYITPVVSTPATYTFYAEAVTCSNSAVRTPVSFTLYPRPTVTIFSGNPSICVGGTVGMTPSGNSMSFSWSPASAPNMTVVGQGIAVSPTVTSSYTLIGYGLFGCTNTAVATISVFPLPIVNVIATTTSICAGSTTTLTPTGASSYAWLPFNLNTMTISAGGVLTTKPTSTTVFTLIGIDAESCSGSKTLTINVLPGPNLLVFSSHPVLCQFESANLVAAGANSYSWNANAIGSNFPTGTLTANTTYTVSGVGPNGCVGSTLFTQSVVACTGIMPGVSDIKKPVVFPNPNKGEFTVSSDVTVELNISNELGQVIKTVVLDETNNYHFTFKNVSAGIYFIKSSDEKDVVNQKIIVTD